MSDTYFQGYQSSLEGSTKSPVRFFVGLERIVERGRKGR